MNFLSNSYKDGYYQHYLETPLIAVCVVGNCGEVVAQLLEHTEKAECKFRVSHVNSFSTLRPKKAKSPLVETSKGLLKTEWCYKHQYQRFSSIVLVIKGGLSKINELSPEESQMLNDAKAYLENSNCRVVITFLSDSECGGVDENSLGEASTSLENSLGQDFYAATVLDKTCINNVDNGLKLRRIVADAGVQYHREEIKRLRDNQNVLVGAGKEASPGGALVRNYFKTGWHYLVIRDYHNARKNMSKAYQSIRSLSQKFASLEARVCASIILRFSASLAPFCGEDISYNSKTVSEIENHIDWLGQAFTAEYSPNCRALLRTLRAFLVADWYTYLAQESLNAPPSTRREYYFSAANCLSDVINDLPDSVLDKLEVPAPPFVGTECAYDAYARMILTTVSKKDSVERVCELLGKGCSVTAAAGMQLLEKEYLVYATQQTLSTLDSEFDEEVCLRQLLAENWKSEYIATALTRTVLSSKRAHHSSTILYAGIHCLGAQAQDETGHVLFFEKISNQPNLLMNEKLSYPHGILVPPLSANVTFSAFACESVSEEVFIEIEVTPTLPIVVILSQVSVGICEMNTTNEVFTVDVPSATALEVAPCAQTSTTVKQKLCFPASGSYFCAFLRANVRLKDVVVNVTLYFPKPDPATTFRGFSNVHPSHGSTVVRVTRPALFATLDFCDGEQIEVIEGESINAKFVVRSLKGALNGCQLRIPGQTKLFSAEIRDPSLNTALERLPIHVSEGKSEREKSVQRYLVGDLTPLDSMSKELVLHGRGLKSGEYVLPVTFSYSTANFHNLELTRHLRIFVDPPFAVSHTFLGSVKCFTAAGLVDVPAVNTLNCRVEKNVLIKTKPSSARSSKAEQEAGNLSLYYAAVDESNCFPDARVFVLPCGEPATLQCQLVCTARNGVEVRKVDVVCTDGVDVIYTSVGDLPCLVEDGETTCVVAKICVTTKSGLFTPGFVRVLFSPITSHDEQLMVDLPLPYIKIESVPLFFSYSYPEVVAAGIPFSLKSTTHNEGAFPFTGEIVLDTQNEHFVVSGRCRWKADIAPKDSYTVEVVLIPTRCGKLRLPFLTLRDGATASLGSRTENTHLVTVIPGCQFTDQ